MVSGAAQKMEGEKLAMDNGQLSIDNSQLPIGYKRTELGVIPEDWEVVRLEKITHSIGDGLHSTPEYDSTGEVFFINGNNLKDGKLVFDNETKKLNKTELKKYNQHLNDKCLLLSINGTIGNLAYYNGEPILLGKSAAYINLNQEVIKDFIYHFLHTSIIAKFFDDSLTGTTIKNLGLGSIRNTPILLPPLPEQQAIADALSDVDGWLASLDALIAKKRDLKTATMQQLLTGHTRLPGFSGEWETKKLGELLGYEQPTKYLVSSSDYDEREGIAVLTANKSFILGYTNESHGIFSNPPVIIFDDFTTASKYVDFPFKVKSSALKILKIRNPKDSLIFVFGKMQLIDFHLSDHKRYWISEYQKQEIKIPAPEEQAAIATILSDIDAEIATLEAEREKASSIKQGMMQELLTGKTRLI